MEKFPQFLLNISDSIVLLLVLIVCAIIPLFKIRVVGRAAVIATFGFAIIILAELVEVAFSAWAVFADQVSYTGLFETLFWIRTILHTLLLVIGFILLAAAIVSRRPTITEVTR